MTNRTINIAFSSIIIVACIIFGYIAMGFRNPGMLAGSQVPTQVFPLLVLSFTGVCAAINIAQYAFGNPEGDASEPFDVNTSIFWRVTAVIGIMIACFFIWDYLGFLPASIFMCVAIAAVLQVKSIPTYIGLAIYAPVIWAVFVYGLGVRF